MNKHFLLSKYSVTYSTRFKADDIANIMEDYVKSFCKEDKLVIDFRGVKAISYSFLDQLLSRVKQSPFLKDECVSIVGWTEDLFPVIDKSLHHRSWNYSRNDESEGKLLVCQS